jgi:hypothetical protein
MLGSAQWESAVGFWPLVEEHNWFSKGLICTTGSFRINDIYELPIIFVIFGLLTLNQCFSEY